VWFGILAASLLSSYGWVFGQDIPGFAGTEYDIVPNADASGYRIVRKYSGAIEDEDVLLTYASNKYEMFAFGASSGVGPVGQIAGTVLGGMFAAEIDLTRLAGGKFNNLGPGHSAQFVHSYLEAGSYWRQLREDIE
jgi:hypothetical protein